MAYKGTLPSELWIHYSQPNGKHLLELDLNVAIDINDKIADATSKAQKKSGRGGLAPLTADDAKGVIARRNARREARRAYQEGLNNT